MNLLFDIYRMLDTKFESAHASDVWLKETFGTTDVESLNLNDVLAQLKEMPKIARSYTNKKTGKTCRALGDDDIRNIQLALADDDYSPKEIALRFGVSKDLVYKIKRGDRRRSNEA